MDTTEELNGTYFYHGEPNLSKIELLNIIFLEEFCTELKIDSVTAAAILSGQPWLATRAKPKGAIAGTSFASKYARIIFRDARLPFRMKVLTPVGVKMQNTTKIAAVIARWLPWVGWASLSMSLYRISTRTQEKYNLIARPKDRIQWTSF